MCRRLVHTIESSCLFLDRAECAHPGVFHCPSAERPSLFLPSSLLKDVLKGYNGTIFAYGQTSSGKTHTMEGPDIHSEMRGVIPRVVENIFKYIEIAPNTIEFSIKISFVEIYLERIRDLLCEGGNNLQINENREKGVYIRHATELYMQSSDELLDVISQGNKRPVRKRTPKIDDQTRALAA